MLIPSPRHTRRDLELWAELEDADRIHAARPQFAARLERSLREIRAFVATRPCHAGVSWGKDSVVLAHLLWLTARHVPLMHLRPSNHNPDCDRVRDAYFVRFPGQPYEEIAVDYRDVDRTLPDEQVDRLTDQRWYAAIREYEAAHGNRHLLGIRSDESFGRRIRTLRWGLSTPRTCAPIAWWTTADVFGYLAKHDLPIHPAYAMLGGGRWPRDRLRVAEIGDTHGKGSGRRDWELEFYGDVLRRLEYGGRPSCLNL
jgi:phosphoadenosine phosphosulfate reductase